jgi:hypothetical protein
MIDTRLVSSLPFQVSSLRGVFSVRLQAFSPSLPLWLEYIFSSWLNPSTPIDGYRHLYKSVGSIHLLKSIGEENDGNHRIFKGVARFGNTQ